MNLHLRLLQTEQWNSISQTGIFYLKTIADHSILKAATKLKVPMIEVPMISYAFAPMKYDSYEVPTVTLFIEPMMGQLFLLTMLLPLITLIGKFMNDKTTRMRESMKIMGINDSTYFLSYFAFYTIFQLIVSFGCIGIVKTAVFPKSNYLLIAMSFFLFGLCIYPFAIIIW